MKPLCWFVVILLSACAHAQSVRDPEAMRILERRLVVLTAAVHGYVRYEQVEAGLTEREIFANATKHDQTLLPEFSEYLLRVRQEDRNASVLLCTRDGTRGLIEDVGCTAEPDRQLWSLPEPHPCEFTVNVREICAAK